MLYIVIKYSPIYSNISSMNIERILRLFNISFYFIDIKRIEYFTAGKSDDGISSFKITQSSGLPASIF